MVWAILMILTLTLQRSWTRLPGVCSFLPLWSLRLDEHNAVIKFAEDAHLDAHGPRFGGLLPLTCVWTLQRLATHG